ncbi:prenyltransferase/squalene oxidase repeat-containing protein [Bremerella sp. JC817]|uniref:prenyltransferase/squalene oxidase repeat-containing protein n=1 Tax=Bremerella sp. JC817 TaxID=3231756 RepID=UPI00345910C9
MAQHSADHESHEEEHQPRLVNRFVLFTAVPSWLISLVVHLVFFMILLTIFMPPVDREKRVLTINDSADAEEIEELVMEEFEPIDEQTLEFDVPPEQPEDAVLSDEIVVSDFQEEMAATQMVELSDFADVTMPFSDIMSEVSGVDGNATAGRGQATRTQMLRENGGTGASEEAVVFGVKWIAEHQLPDGTWNFDHRRGAKKPGSKDFGTASNSPRAATAMALLPFLGSGITHKEGKYKKQVEAGLGSLIKLMEVRGDTGSFREGEGNMYSHGLATIALCEAYAMTQDKNLLGPSQYAINYIQAVQDPVGGGWRYQPRQPGDTSVVGWQVMGLKSGHMGYLSVNKNTIAGAIKFLDSVQTQNGAAYGYADPGSKPSMNAVGLLCRMYTGWKKENPALQQGVANLAKAGPSLGNRSDMYYNYYATQVMRQYGGAQWDGWNTKMRDFLVKNQVPQDQAEAGSWHFDGPHTERGGRLYNTSLSVLTLEVYYRHLPIYKANASEEDFPL